MKIGILTYHRAKNYGAYLQAYGLCTRLNEEADITAEIIDFHMKKEVAAYRINSSLKYRVRHFQEYCFRKKLYSAFENSMEELPVSDEYCCSDDPEDLRKLVQGKYDVILAGSDEIWKTDGIRSFPNPYWLEGDMGCLKVSYAASSRSDLSAMPCQQRQKIKKYLKDFSYISVRDQITGNQFKKIFGSEKEIHLDPDPSLFCHYHGDRERGRRLLEVKAGLDLRRKTAVVMTENDEVAQAIRKEFQKEYQLVSVFHWHRGYKNIADLTPFEWLNVLISADFLFTSYFHATCFAIVYNVPFLAFGTRIKSSKLRDVLAASSNSERFVLAEADSLQSDLLRKAHEKLQGPVDNRKFCGQCETQFEVFLSNLRACCKENSLTAKESV